MSSSDQPVGGDRVQCPTAKFALHAYVDGEFDVLQTVSLERLVSHLEDCTGCGDYLEQLRALKEKLRCSCGCAVPADLEQRIVTRITQLYTDGDSVVYSDDIRIQRS